MTDPATIAKGLTKAQREAILQLRGDGRTGSSKQERISRSRLLRAMPDFVTHHFAGDSRKYYLTSLGLAVRAHLENNT